MMKPHEVIAECVARGEVPGAVTLVARGDDVQVATAGAMTRDTIVRIASMTKPITAATALALVDDGTLRLDDSIERWVPELAGRRVLRPASSQRTAGATASPSRRHATTTAPRPAPTAGTAASARRGGPTRARARSRSC